MSTIIQDLATTRKEALVGLLKLFQTERLSLSHPQVSFIVSEPEPELAEELQLAAPYINRPTYTKTLFVLRRPGEYQRSVAFAISDGYITVGAHDAPDQALFAGKNIYVYHLENVGHAIQASISFLLNDTDPFDSQTALRGLNGIQNSLSNFALDESFSLPG